MRGLRRGGRRSLVALGLGILLGIGLPRGKRLGLVTYPAPDPELRGPAPILPQDPESRRPLERIPLARWWERTTTDHLARLRLTGTVQGALADLEISGELRRPRGLGPGESRELTEDLRTHPWSWIQEGSLTISGQSRTLVPGPLGGEDSGEAPALDWLGPGRFRWRFPGSDQAGATGFRYRLGVVLPPQDQQRLQLPLMLTRLPVARLEVDLLVEGAGPDFAPEAPGWLQASREGPGKVRFRGARERVESSGGWEISWRSPTGCAASIPLSATQSLVRARGAFLGSTPFWIQGLRTGEAAGTPASDLAPSYLAGLTQSAAALSGEIPGYREPLRRLPEVRPVLPWYRREPTRIACAAVRQELQGILRSFNQRRGTRFPASVAGAPRRWVHLDLAEPLAVRKSPRIQWITPRDFLRALPSAPGEWMRFAFLVPELVEEGLIPELPRDPGFAAGSLDHYLLMGSGEVLCRVHDAARLEQRGIPGWLRIPRVLE